MGRILRLALARGLTLALVLACASCSSATESPAQSAQAVDSSRETTMAGFVLTSPSFDEGGAILVRHSCDGTNVSPALNWQGAPQGTVSFALIVDDPDAPFQASGGETSFPSQV